MHIFPEDYSPRAAEREKFQQMRARQEELDEAAYSDNTSPSPDQSTLPAEAAAAAQFESMELAAECPEPAPIRDSAPETDSQNSQKPAPLAGSNNAPDDAILGVSLSDVLKTTAKAASHSGGRSQNSQNSAKPIVQGGINPPALKTWTSFGKLSIAGML